MGFNDESEEVLHTATEPLFALWSILHCIVLHCKYRRCSLLIILWYGT